MKTREIFQQIRNQKGGDSLRLRLTLLVSAEIVVSILLALGLYYLLADMIPMDDTWLLLLDLIVISLVVGSVVTLVMSRYFFDPIKKLGKAMEQVADGDFSVRLDEKSSSKEIMEVYTGFNMMAHELSATEILQTDFVSNVSHEFKTPINAIEGYAMLLQGGQPTDDQALYVEKILLNTHRLSDLVGNILLLSRIDNQAISAAATTYRLDEQIRQAILLLENKWATKDLDVDVDLEEIFYTGNESMLQHVWVNLIDNAIKFNPVGGLLRIRLLRQEQQLIFTVEDRGPGIPLEAQSHIFDKFYQADSSHTSEGNGLGLALTRQVLDSCGGTVRAENLPDTGCRFTVTLPCLTQ